MELETKLQKRGLQVEWLGRGSPIENLKKGERKGRTRREKGMILPIPPFFPPLSNHAYIHVAKIGCQPLHSLNHISTLREALADLQDATPP